MFFSCCSTDMNSSTKRQLTELISRLEISRLADDGQYSEIQWAGAILNFLEQHFTIRDFSTEFQLTDIDLGLIIHMLKSLKRVRVDIDDKVSIVVSMINTYYHWN